MLRIRPLLVLALILLACVAPTAVAQAASLGFTTPKALPDSPPTGSMQGGEPSVAFDPSGDGHVYFVAPGGSDEGTGGINFWGSDDHGKTIARHFSIGSVFGGGDSDIDVGVDHTVFGADLEVVASAICISHDFGKTFPGGCQDTGLPPDQAGPEADREWLTPSRNDRNVIYLTYHDFAAELPIVERSTDGGSTWAPCGNVLEPGSAAQQNFSTGGTDVGKPVVGKDESLYVPITEPSSPLVTSNYNNFYVAVADGGCTGVTQFKDYTIYSNPGANLANIFSDIAMDGAGNLYAAASGKLTADQTTYGTYVWVSRDKGKTWSKPIRVNTANLTANVLPALAGGLRGGQVTLGWYGTSTSGDPNNSFDTWRYYAATSTNYGKTFSQAMVTPTVFHFGDVCTIGILCGTPGEADNRNLLDFSSIGVDPSTGCVLTVFPGDPYDTPGHENTTAAAAYVARQTAGACLR
jgi:hypothetical protein